MKHINMIELSSVRIPVRSGKGGRWLKLLTVAYIKGNGKASTIVDIQKNTFADSLTLSMHEVLLSEYGIFLRIHKSYLVNTHYVSGWITHKRSLFVLLDCGSKIPVARNKREQFFSFMDTYIPEKYKIMHVAENPFTP